MPILEVHVSGARNLPASDALGGVDPKCTISFEGHQYRTATINGNHDPEWNELFKFNVADENSSQLRFVVWDEDAMSDDFIGEYRMSVSGLTRGEPADNWVLLQNCKSNAELHIKLIAVDFGEIPEGAEVPPPVAQPPMMQAAPPPAPFFQAQAPQQYPGQTQPMAQPATMSTHQLPPAGRFTPEHGAVVEIIPRHAPNKRLDVQGGNSGNGAQMHLWDPNGTAAQRFKFICRKDGTITFLAQNAVFRRSIDNGGGPNRPCHLWDVADHPNQKWRLEPTDSGFFMLRSVATNCVIDIDRASRENGARVATYASNGGPNQQFFLNTVVSPRQVFPRPAEDAIVEIVPRNEPTMRVTMDGGRTDNGTHMQIHPPNGSPAQRFKIYAHQSGAVSFLAENTGFGSALDNGGSPNRPVHLWQCVDTPNQKWRLDATDNGYFYVRSEATGCVLDVAGNSREAGAEINSWQSHGADNQQFRFIVAGTYRAAPEHGAIVDITPRHATEKTLDVENGRSDNGAQLHLWDPNGTAAQRFKAMYHADGTVSFLPQAAVFRRALDNGGGPNRPCHLWDVADHPNQKWRLEPTDSGFFMIRSVATNCVIDIDRASRENGARVATYAANGGPNQQFAFSALVAPRDQYPVPTSGTLIELAPRNAPHLRVDVVGGQAANGTPLNLAAPNGSPAQRMRVFHHPDGAVSFLPECTGFAGAVDNSNGQDCPLGVMQCVDHPNQKWRMEPIENGFFIIRNEATGCVFDVAGGNCEPGAQMLSYQPHGNANQQFKVYVFQQ